MEIYENKLRFSVPLLHKPLLDASTDSIEGFTFLENKIINPIREKANKELNVSGIILNNNDKRSNFSNAVLKTIIRLYGDKAFDTNILASIKHKESRASRLPIIEYDPKHDASKLYELLTNEFLERFGENNGEEEKRI